MDLLFSFDNDVTNIYTIKPNSVDISLQKFHVFVSNFSPQLHIFLNRWLVILLACELVNSLCTTQEIHLQTLTWQTSITELGSVLQITTVPVMFVECDALV